MTEQSLTPRDRVVLIALVALAEEVSNKDLQERVGFRLDGEPRKRLNDAGFVDSRKVGQAYVHRITDAGRIWFRAEMSAPHPVRSDSGTRSLYAVLASLDGYLQRSSVKVSELFEPAATVVTEDDQEAIERKVRAAYEKLADEPGDWVRLTEVRPLLSGAARKHVDEVLIRLSTADGVNIVPDADQGRLTPEDRAAAVSIGGQDKHLITIRGL